MSVVILIDMIESWTDVTERVVAARRLVSGKVQKVFGGKRWRGIRVEWPQHVMG